MHRIDSSDAVDSKFTEGNLAGQQATQITAAWLNAQQEELANLLEHYGVVLNKEVNTQLRDLLIPLLSITPKIQSGFLMSNNVADGLNAIDIAGGTIIDSTGNDYIVGSPLTKTLHDVWSVGNGGGLRPSSVASTPYATYHIFVFKTEDGNVDYAADTTITAANIVSLLGAVMFARIGFVVNGWVGGYGISGFFQTGPLSRRVTTWKNPLVEVDNTYNTDSHLHTLKRIPNGKIFEVGLTAALSAGHGRISSPLAGDLDPASGASNLSEKNGTIVVQSNTAQQIRSHLSANAHLYVAVEFVIDSLGV